MTGPHEAQVAASAGESLDSAKAVVIMLHGRGDSAQGILGLQPAIQVPGAAYVAPQAAHNTWYPNSFMAPVESNQPWLDSALRTVGAVVEQAVLAGVPHDKVVLLGFSQGACLVTEFAARNARRYGGLVGLSGGLIGPAGTPRSYDGSLAGTPVFLGCSDVDPHIPVERVRESAEVLSHLGGLVDERIYPGFSHAVNQDEVDAVRVLLEAVVGA